MTWSVIRIACVVSNLSVFAILSSPGLVAGQATEFTAADDPGYSITVGSHTLSNVQPGAIISQATRLADGRCNNGEMVIDIQGRRGYEGVVSVSIDTHCTIRLTEVSWQPLVTPFMTGVAFSSEEKSAYTKSEINDPFEIDLMMARVDIEYVTDGNTLSDGDVDHECDKAIHWELHSCTSARNQTSSTRMWGWTRADGDGFNFPPTYAKARVTVYPDKNHRHSCFHGQTYPGTHWHCRTGSS